ncbi:unnamed protein product [Merluccius merluccius]
MRRVQGGSFLALYGFSAAGETSSTRQKKSPRDVRYSEASANQPGTDPATGHRTPASGGTTGRRDDQDTGPGNGTSPGSVRRLRALVAAGACLSPPVS